MQRKLMFSILALVGCLAMAGLSSAQSCADIQGATGCAPSPIDGASVTLTGIVYAVQGLYNPGSVYFNCGSGGNGGMTFYDSGLTAPVAVGDEITVEGIVGSFQEDIQLINFQVTINSSGNPYTAEVIATGDLADGTSHMGGLMQVTGLLTKTGSLTYTLDDGSGPVVMYIDVTTGIETNVVDQWQGDMVTVRGATKCYQGEGEILPRSFDDISLHAVAQEPSSWGSIKSTYR